MVRHTGDQLCPISIHVPARGTKRVDMRSASQVYFNPRARVGHDIQYWIVRTEHLFQSTRPRGARRNTRMMSPRTRDFNPRARGGHDFATVRDTWYMPFQSTCPRGARRESSNNTKTDKFQSTCPRGARPN